MRQSTTILDLPTPGQGLHLVTAPIIAWISEQAMRDGLLTLFLQHTSASLLVQENASPPPRASRPRTLVRAPRTRVRRVRA